jgi:predicted SnoaL-like aldol condensation-catalyzing enzyme
MGQAYEKLAAIAMLAALAGCGAGAGKSEKAAAAATDPVKIIEAFDNTVMQHKAREAMEKYVSEDFIEHDPTVKGGNRQGLLDYMVKAGWDEDSNPFPEMRDVVDRRFGSGEYVVTQHHIFRDKNDRGTVFVDTFRVVNGKIVEHWDVAQPVPEKTADNPNTMW